MTLTGRCVSETSCLCKRRWGGGLLRPGPPSESLPDAVREPRGPHRGRGSPQDGAGRCQDPLPVCVTKARPFPTDTQAVTQEGALGTGPAGSLVNHPTTLDGEGHWRR